MNAIRNISLQKWLLLPALMCLFLGVLEANAFAQVPGGGGGAGGGGVGGGGAIPPIPVVGDGNQAIDGGIGDGIGDGAGGAGGGAGGNLDGEIDAIEPLRLTRLIEDRRNQGFVGSTASSIDENRFVGPQTGDPDGDLAEGRFIGGTVNAGLGMRSAAGSTVLLQRGFTPEENGFTVQRAGLRTRLRPAFAAPQRPSAVTVSRFQTRMLRQPVVRNFGQGMSISVSNRTAVLTGQVRSQAERDIIKRQLRLEPGVYKIDDRTSIAN